MKYERLTDGALRILVAGGNSYQRQYAKYELLKRHACPACGVPVGRVCRPDCKSEGRRDGLVLAGRAT